MRSSARSSHERLPDRRLERFGPPAELGLGLLESPGIERDPGLAERLHHRGRLDAQPLADPQLFLEATEVVLEPLPAGVSDGLPLGPYEPEGRPEVLPSGQFLDLAAHFREARRLPRRSGRGAGELGFELAPSNLENAGEDLAAGASPRVTASRT